MKIGLIQATIDFPSYIDEHGIRFTLHDMLEARKTGANCILRITYDGLYYDITVIRQNIPIHHGTWAEYEDSDYLVLENGLNKNLSEKLLSRGFGKYIQDLTKMVKAQYHSMEAH